MLQHRMFIISIISISFYFNYISIMYQRHLTKLISKRFSSVLLTNSSLKCFTVISQQVGDH